MPTKRTNIRVKSNNTAPKKKLARNKVENRIFRFSARKKVVEHTNITSVSKEITFTISFHYNSVFSSTKLASNHRIWVRRNSSPFIQTLSMNFCNGSRATAAPNQIPARFIFHTHSTYIIVRHLACYLKLVSRKREPHLPLIFLLDSFSFKKALDQIALRK